MHAFLSAAICVWGLSSAAWRVASAASPTAAGLASSHFSFAFPVGLATGNLLPNLHAGIIQALLVKLYLVLGGLRHTWQDVCLAFTFKILLQLWLAIPRYFNRQLLIEICDDDV